jgi:outer membrane protein TolC
MRKLMISLLIVAAALGFAGSSARAASAILDLADLLDRADASNPEILAAQARVEALKHVPSQLEAYPDPTASVSYTNETLTALTLGSRDMSNLTFSWTQEVPFPGKLRLAGDVARAEVDVSSGTLETTRLRLRAAVKVAYADLYRIDRTTSILEESRKLLATFREAARVRQETGQGILENVLKAQTELTRVDVELAGLAQERRSAAAALNALVGSPDDAPLAVAVAAPTGDAPDPVSAEKAALDRSPELATLRAATRRDENRVSLAKRNTKPDFMWGAGYANRGSLDPMVMGMFGIRLPLYKNRKQKEAIVQTEYDLKATERDLDHRNVTLLAEVRGLLARADRASEQTRLIREGTLPLARSSLDAAAAAYSAGRAEFVTLIEDFRAFLGYESDLEMLHADKIRALAALEPLTGAEYVLPGDPADAPGDAHE